MNLALAEALSNGTLAERRQRGFKPLAITVVDAQGQTIVSKREDAVPTAIPKLSEAKALSCVGLGMSSRALRDKYEAKSTQIACMASITPLAPFPGGVLLRTADGGVLGAIGVSGAAADEDEHCAIISARALGVECEPVHSQLE